jgi:hypothetical protein
MALPVPLTPHGHADIIPNGHGSIAPRFR